MPQWKVAFGNTGENGDPLYVSELILESVLIFIENL